MQGLLADTASTPENQRWHSECICTNSHLILTSPQKYWHTSKLQHRLSARPWIFIFTRRGDLVQFLEGMFLFLQVNLLVFSSFTQTGLDYSLNGLVDLIEFQKLVEGDPLFWVFFQDGFDELHHEVAETVR